MRDLLPYLRYIKPYRGILFLAVVCGILFGVSSGAGIPVIFEKVFKKVFEDPNAHYTTIQITLIAVAIPFAFLIRGIFGFCSTYLMSFCSIKLLQDIRRDVFDNIQQYPLSFFEKNTSGDLLTRISSDPGILQEALLEMSTELIRQSIQALSAMGALVYFAFSNKHLFFILVLLLAIPLIMTPVHFLRKKLKKRGREVQNTFSHMAQHLIENLGSIQEIRSFNLEERQSQSFLEKVKNYARLELKVRKYEQLQQPAMEFLATIIISVVFIYAYQTKVPFSTFSAMGLALYFGIDPLKRVGKVISRINRSHGSIERINEMLNYEPEFKDAPNAKPLKNAKGTIEFKDVSFRYPNTEDWALEKVNIQIPAGSFCALVGASGAGKSTFAKLIPRFYEAIEGNILIDDQKLSSLRIKSLRENIAVVSQSPILFNDTLFNNIKIGKHNATEAEVIAAAKNAYADDFIQKMEKGYETLCGERGDKLSGGQRQRIAIARAFLKSAPILILDEATSALDSESEHFIQKALKKLAEGRTVITIAHRLSTIQDADNILVFEKGHIITNGTHKELLKKSNVYKNLVQKQQLKTD